MSDAIIKVEGLGKRYTLHHQARSGLLRDRIAGLFHNTFQRTKTAAATEEEFWALRDVNFTVNPGDVVGIIGRNGAGKSTLLKILSRITEPTTGRITINGRVASLLEVGTGFHGELSGRENIFLNGAILGMTRAEIKKKFDEIVAFSEVEKFLDTPVKHYSSGMYVRLAFAVAAHLEPEILIVDEVLAVGDQEFQKKCLGKMHEVASGQGRTVLFVSHNTSALLNVCDTGILLEQGRLSAQGDIKTIVNSYLETGLQRTQVFSASADRPHITTLEVDADALAAGDLIVNVGFRSPCPIVPVVGIVLSTDKGQPISGCNGRMIGSAWRPPAATEGVVKARLSPLLLHSGVYFISIWLSDPATDYDERRNALQFTFVSKNFYPQCPSIDEIGAADFAWKWE